MRGLFLKLGSHLETPRGSVTSFDPTTPSILIGLRAESTMPSHIVLGGSLAKLLVKENDLLQEFVIAQLGAEIALAWLIRLKSSGTNGGVPCSEVIVGRSHASQLVMLIEGPFREAFDSEDLSHTADFFDNTMLSVGQIDVVMDDSERCVISPTIPTFYSVAERFAMCYCRIQCRIGRSIRHHMEPGESERLS
jgi:hypothetical protein